MPFFLWLRLVVGERLLRIHRQHLDAAMRSAGREISLQQRSLPEASSASLAAHLLGRMTSASRAAVRAERQVQLQEVLNGMDETDREVIALRHFEELGNDEVAAVLGLTRAAASKRYVRAMVRLKAVLSSTPGLADPTEGEAP
jgi:RNA polymerase sigma-70 factor (ECF subfamily)